MLPNGYPMVTITNRLVSRHIWKIQPLNQNSEPLIDMNKRLIDYDFASYQLM